MNNIRISRYVHVLDIKESELIVVFNALSMSVAVIDISILNNINLRGYKSISKEDLLLLRKNKILTTLKEDEDDLTTAREFFQRKIIGTLCLMLTDACNLRCSYCFVENRFPADHEFSMMTEEIAKQGIDLFASKLPESKKNGLEEPTINFYGGEATLNRRTLIFSLNYIEKLKKQKKLPSNLLISLNTNATLMDAKLARVLKLHNVSASVSIDGSKHIHDMARVNCDGSGSFDKAIAGIQILRNAGVSVGVSCAVDMHNLSSLEEVAEWFIANLDVKVFGFNILLEGGKKYLNFNRSSYSEIVGEKMVKIFQMCREKGAREERTARLATAFALGQIHYYDCGACGQQIVLDPSGLVGVCHSYTEANKKKYFVPYDKDIDPFCHPNWQEWRRRSPLNMEECQGCIALTLCGGGCPYNADYQFGSIWKVDRGYCPFAKKMTKFLISDVAKRLISK